MLLVRAASFRPSSSSPYARNQTSSHLRTSQFSLTANNASLNHNMFLQQRFASVMRFTKDHEWIKVDGDKGFVGISDFAQNALGDVVYVDLPEVGRTIKQKDTIVAVESVKVTAISPLPSMIIHLFNKQQ